MLRVWMFSPLAQEQNKTSTLATCIQYFTEISRKINLKRIEIKCIEIRKWMETLFAGDMILYLENLKKYT